MCTLTDTHWLEQLAPEMLQHPILVLVCTLLFATVYAVGSNDVLPGCFYDHVNTVNQTSRQLPSRQCWIHGPLPNDCAHLSRERCGQLCRDAGFQVAGVEASHECTCGHELSHPNLVVPSSECDEVCTGDENETCGAAFRLWAFNASSVGPPKPLPPGPPPGPGPPPPRPLVPPDPFYRPIFHAPADNSAGYVGDANGMMFRRVPWNSSSNEGGLFHLFWQAMISHGLWWGHAVSKDYVRWHTLPWNTSIGPGAESGGATQLPNGDIVTIFNDLGNGDALGSGLLTARPFDRADPLLQVWQITNKVNGPMGSDMASGWLGEDGLYRIIASCGAYQTAIPYGEVCIFVSNDTMRTWIRQTAPGQPAPGVLHRYDWMRCTKLPAQCGGHTNPCDPGMFEIPGTGVSVVYTMQKTCQCSGREFYALGMYNRSTHSFTLLDNTSDLGNNVWDGGEGYAHMNVLDPRGAGDGRMLWTGAVIEGDRDPSSCADSGFPSKWTNEKGWFGTLTLPRVVELGNLTTDSGVRDLFLQTPPLPELALLRESVAGTTIKTKLFPNAEAGAAVAITGAYGRSVEVFAKFTAPTASGWDFGIQLLWSNHPKNTTRAKVAGVAAESADSVAEFTRVGVRDGSLMPGIDLWDEVNGDRLRIEGTKSVSACRTRCEGDSGCGAWTFTAVAASSGVCRLKAHSQHSLLVVHGSPGCFLPTYGNFNGNYSWSGFIQQKSVQFAQLYVERTNTNATLGNRSFASFGYAQMLRLLPTEPTIDVHAFVDRSIVEVFGQRGRGVVTARVYPSRASSNQIGLYNRGTASVSVIAQAWTLGGANTTREDVLAVI